MSLLPFLAVLPDYPMAVSGLDDACGPPLVAESPQVFSTLHSSASCMCI